MLKIVMLIIGVFLMAPVAIVAFIFALPVLPFLVVGFLAWKLFQSRRSEQWPALETGHVFPDALMSRYPAGQSNMLAPVTLATLALLAVVQIKFVGFFWQLDLGLVVAMLVIGALWLAQRRIDSRRRRRGAHKGEVARHDLYRLFEIERASDPEERRVLIVREFNRLTLEALRPDPTIPDDWPAISVLKSLRDQISLLRASARDTATSSISQGSLKESPSTPALAAQIQTLEDYVNQLLRVRLLGQADLEQMRILVRDQSRLREMQDLVVGELQQSATISAAG